jgi:hypothetical protein
VPSLAISAAALPPTALSPVPYAEADWKMALLLLARA